MSDHLDNSPRLYRLALVGLGVFFVCGIGCAAGYFWQSERFFPAYLTAYLFWFEITLGCLALAMLHGLTGGGWGIAVRRVLEAGYQTLPWLALAFVPIWHNLHRIYVWTDPEVVRHHESLQRKAAYLDVEAFQVRAIIYFAIWFIVSLFLNLYSPGPNSPTEQRRRQRLQKVSGLGMIAFAVTITLASVDWVMSLEPAWFSSMYGVLYMAGAAVSGLSFAILIVALLQDLEPWATIVTEKRRHDLGNLLLAFVMFWAYVNLMQFLIIWSGNLPEENVWYLRRSSGGWLYVVVGLAVFHFAAPFLMLLSRRQKQHAAGLARIAALLLAVRYVNLAWLAMPGFVEHETETLVSSSLWLDVAAWGMIGGGWIALFAWRLAVRCRVPIYEEPQEEIHHAPHGQIVGA
jgi:hypothetical protein